jgi:nucleotide-binding universal stress UspA family protein
MPYKTILVHADASRHAAERIRIAAELALRHDAHLVGAAATGLPRQAQREGGASLEHMALLNQLDSLRRDAESALEAVEAAVRRSGVLSWEIQLIDDDVGEGISLLARYADLVLLGQADPDDRLADLTRGLAAQVLLRAGRPVLLVPYVGSYAGIGRRPLIAWDGSLGASRAIAGALPLLREAGSARVVVFNARRQGDVHGEQPGADLALYLARHRLQIEVLQETTEQDIGSALLALASDVNADLLVMGCYGHTRLREMLVGSTSRTVLETMSLPVLMAH